MAVYLYIDLLQFLTKPEGFSSTNLRIDVQNHKMVENHDWDHCYTSHALHLRILVVLW